MGVATPLRFYIDVTGIRFVDASSVSQPTVLFLKIVNARRRMSKGESICQEFSDDVSVGATVLKPHPLRLFGSREEIKCYLNIEHFTPLVQRMVQVGYCCTQVQKDLKTEKCTAWFEPRSDGEL